MATKKVDRVTMLKEITETLEVYGDGLGFWFEWEGRHYLAEPAGHDGRERGVPAGSLHELAALEAVRRLHAPRRRRARPLRRRRAARSRCPPRAGAPRGGAVVKPSNRLAKRAIEGGAVDDLLLAKGYYEHKKAMEERLSAIVGETVKSHWLFDVLMARLREVARGAQ